MNPLSLNAWALLLVPVLVALLIARFRPFVSPPWLDRLALGPVFPLVAAALSVVTTWYIWGGLDPVTYIHDEAAYLLQAEMLAQGRFAAPPRPLPEFFEQFHVFVTPVLASRYPPGWALALVPGIWVGIPTLMPLLLTGATAALLVILVRRLADAPTALAAWVLWNGSTIELRFRASFLSQSLSTFLWLLTFWALWRWRDDRRLRWLVIVSVAVAWDGITRPLTGMALAVPVGLVVLYDVWQGKRWRQLAIATAAGLLLCGLVPLQNHAVTGNWRETPIWRYARLYTPYDVPGFGLETARPLVPETEERRAFGRFFRPVHANHLAERLPEILAERSVQVFDESRAPWGGYGLLVLVIAGVVFSGAPMAVATLGAIMLMVLYLWFAHPTVWTVYYLEAHLVLAAAAAVGARRIVAATLRLVPPPAPPAPDAPPRTTGPALVALALFASLNVPINAQIAHYARAGTIARHVAVRQAVEALPAPAILFIRYAPDHKVHRGFVENPYDLASAPVWRVHDLGAHNTALMALAPDRKAFLFDEATLRAYPLASDGVTILTDPETP